MGLADNIVRGIQPAPPPPPPPKPWSPAAGWAGVRGRNYRQDRGDNSGKGTQGMPNRTIRSQKMPSHPEFRNSAGYRGSSGQWDDLDDSDEPASAVTGGRLLAYLLGIPAAAGAAGGAATWYATRNKDEDDKDKPGGGGGASLTESIFNPYRIYGDYQGGGARSMAGGYRPAGAAEAGRPQRIGPDWPAGHGPDVSPGSPNLNMQADDWYGGDDNLRGVHGGKYDKNRNFGPWPYPPTQPIDEGGPSTRESRPFGTGVPAPWLGVKGAHWRDPKVEDNPWYDTPGPTPRGVPPAEWNMQGAVQNVLDTMMGRRWGQTQGGARGGPRPRPAAPGRGNPMPGGIRKGYPWENLPGSRPGQMGGTQSRPTTPLGTTGARGQTPYGGHSRTNMAANPIWAVLTANMTPVEREAFLDNLDPRPPTGQDPAAHLPPFDDLLDHLRGRPHPGMADTDEPLDTYPGRNEPDSDGPLVDPFPPGEEDFAWMRGNNPFRGSAASAALANQYTGMPRLPRASSSLIVPTINKTAAGVGSSAALLALLLSQMGGGQLPQLAPR